MADLPTAPTAPGAEEGLVADRMRFWSSFTGTTRNAAIAITVLLILMAIFLV